MDFTGHLFVKFGEQVVKFYLLVFTCLNIRAIHIELLPSMTTKDFLFAFVRFSNLYAIPDSIYSDNASSFLQSMGIIANSYSNNEFDDYLIKNNVKHIKIPLYSAWVGAHWERMIRTIKGCIHKVIGRKQLEYFELLTLISDVQNAINSRPLTYLSDNFAAITPNSFLKLYSGGTLVLDAGVGSEIIAADRLTLTRALERRDDLFSNFKELWYDQYLISLRENAKDLYQENWCNKVSVGDVVLVTSSNKPRHQWQMGRVTELLPGKEGIVRAVRVMRPAHNEGIYSINLLYPFELSLTPGRDATTIAEVEEPPPAQRQRPPRRKAAHDCMQRLRTAN